MCARGSSTSRRHVASNAIPGQKQRYVLCTQADKEALQDLQITNDGLQERLAQLGDFAYIPCVGMQHHMNDV